MRFKRISNWICRVRTRLPHALHSSHLPLAGAPLPHPFVCDSLQVSWYRSGRVAQWKARVAAVCAVCVCVCAGLSQLQGWQIWLNYSAIAKRFIFRPGAQLHFAGMRRLATRTKTHSINCFRCSCCCCCHLDGALCTLTQTQTQTLKRALPLTQSQSQSQPRRARTPCHQSGLRALHGLPSIRLHLSIRQRSARWRCK